MQEFIYWLNEYGVVLDLTQVIVSVATAFAAIALVIATVALIRVTKKKPFVVCTMESNTNNKRRLTLIIKNTGDATAFDIKANIEASKKTIGGKEISNFSISILTPDKGFIPSSSIRAWEIPVTFNIDVSWASRPRGRRKHQKYTIECEKGGWHEAGLDQLVEIIANGCGR